MGPPEETRFHCTIERPSARRIHPAEPGASKAPGLPLALRRRWAPVLGLELDLDVIALSANSGAKEDITLLDTVDLAAEETESWYMARSG